MVSRKAIRRPVAAAQLPDFTPVPRQRPRHDGWTPERQRAFIEALADTGCVAIAARMVNMSPEGVYQLRRQPGAESFRAAMDAAQTIGLQPVKDECFHRAMVGQLVPVFVGGKLMGFRRKKNDRLLMFILRHYGQDAQGRKTTVNYFSTRATAGAAQADPAADPSAIALAKAEASTTTVKTVISGPAGAPTQIANDDEAANILNAFEGVALDAEAQAEIYRTLQACAERRRALEDDPENDPERFFIGPEEAGDYLGELESGVEGDWVEYRPEGEHHWESLGEGGGAAEADRVVAGIEARRAALTPKQLEAQRAAWAEQARLQHEKQNKSLPAPLPDPDDARLDWRNWQDGGDKHSSPAFAGEGDHVEHGGGAMPANDAPISPRTGKPLRRYKKRQPKPPFTPPDEARKAEAVAEVEALRREGATAAAERRLQRKSDAGG
ncbi:MAG TPA: hypothetical protein VK614_10605 [Allosphingosinicella sp.]|nr:hypothetical protein [Allosphingosinicella sp.]